jgi:hypothetical protein
VLLHPLDVLGGDDLPTGSGLEFFPGMTMAGGRKRALVRDCLLLLRERFDVGSVGRHARSLEAADLPLRAAPPAPAVRAPVR